MSEQTTLHPNDLEDLRHVLSLSGKGEAHTLNLADPAQARFYRRIVGNAGMTPQKYPQFFKMLDNAQNEHVRNGGPVVAMANDSANTAGLIDLNTITSTFFNNAPAQANTTGAPISCNASALSSINGGTIFTQLSLQIVDIATGNVLASTSNPAVYGQGEYLPVYTQGTTAVGSQGVSAIFTYSYQKYNQVPVFGNLHLDLNDEPQGIPVVTQPVLAASHKQMGYLTFGIGRQQGFVPVADCDYYWYEQNIDNPIVRVPLVGSQKFRSKITSAITANDITCYMVMAQAGGAGTPIQPTTALLNGISISPNDQTTLTWNFPYNYNLSLDQSIQFGPATFNPDSQTLILFQVRVKTQNSGNDYVAATIYGIAPTNTMPNPPWSPSPYDQPGLYAMRPFQYTWHCVAADTMVKMASGTMQRIDSLAGGDLVQTNAQGATLKVTHTIFADKDSTVLSIRDEHGHHLLITKKHGVATPDGIRLAEELQAGDTWITEKGNSKIVSVESKPFHGRVWTIGLAHQDDNESALLKDDTRTFFANGILISDSHGSFNRHVEHKRLLKTILAKIPSEWHQDAQSSFAHHNTIK